jgi:hypothetical protein
MRTFFVGVDLGRQQDYTAIAIMEKKLVIKGPETFTDRIEGVNAIQVPFYQIRHIERLSLGTTYPEIVERIQKVLHHPELYEKTVLIVDQTGVGRPVVDSLRREKLNPIGITITGGSNVVEEEGGLSYKVPKLDLVSALHVLLESQRLTILSTLEYAPVLKQELLQFKVKVSETGKETLEAWREQDHDDLVLSVCLCSWYALKIEPNTRELLSGDVWQKDEKRNKYDPVRRC